MIKDKTTKKSKPHYNAAELKNSIFAESSLTIKYAMETTDYQIGAKVEHPQFGVGVVTKKSLTTTRVFFLHKGDKDIANSFTGLKLIEDSHLPEGGDKGQISLSDLEKVFSGVLRRYADFPETVEIGDRWKKGILILRPGSDQLKAKEIPIDNFFKKIILIRDRLRVLEQRINSNERLGEEEKMNLQQYITRIYGSLTTFNVLFKHKEQYFVGEKGEV